MYVAPESKVLLALANVAATSSDETTMPALPTLVPPCMK